MGSLKSRPPSCALDFGVMMRDGVAHSRICFWGVFTKKHKRVSLDGDEASARSPLARRRPSLVSPRSSFSLPSPATSPAGPESRRRSVGPHKRPSLG